MPLEVQAHEEIDRQLTACGWAVQNYAALNLAAAPGIAVREFPPSGSGGWLSLPEWTGGQDGIKFQN
jgi:hypothetical protein